MEPILSKQEIADLLQTLQHEGAAVSKKGPDEITGIGADHPEIDLFALPAGTLQPMEIPNFDLIIERFRVVFSRSLSRHLQRTVSMTTIENQTVPFSDYLVVKEQRRIIGMLGLKPMNSSLLLSFDAYLWFLLLEILLGGVNSPGMNVPDRSPTRLELSLLTSMMETACKSLDQTFLPLLQINSSVIETASESRAHSFASPTSVMIVYRFQVQVDEESGILELVTPIEPLLPYKSSLAKLTQLNSIEGRNWPNVIKNNLDTMPITIMAQSCVIDLSIQQLIDLKVGDVIPIDQEPDGSVKILVEGIPKFSGFQGSENHKKSVKITDIYQ
jgi:flagellar motor switch protein FliM